METSPSLQSMMIAQPMKKKKEEEKMMIAQPPQATRIVIPLNSIPILPGNIQNIGFRGN